MEELGRLIPPSFFSPLSHLQFYYIVQQKEFEEGLTLFQTALL